MSSSVPVDEGWVGLACAQITAVIRAADVARLQLA